MAAPSDAPPVVFDLERPGPARPLGDVPAVAVAIRGGSPEVVAVTEDDVVRTWSAVDGRARTAIALPPVEVGAGATALVLTPDDRVALVARASATTQVVDLAAGALGRTLPGRVLANPAALTADGAAALVVGADGALALAALTSDATIALDGGGAVTVDAALSADGRRIAAARADGTTRIWERDRHDVHRDLAAPTRGPATAIAWTADGEHLLVGTVDGAILVHPTTLAAAQARACATLRRFGRAAAAAHCAIATSPNHIRAR